MSEKIFYSIEVSYNSDNEVKIFRIPNITPAKLKEFRETVFLSGVYRPIDSVTGEILSPWQIRQIMVYRQARFFKHSELNMKLTKD